MHVIEDGSVVFPEYRYKGITGNEYTPYFRDDKWFVVPSRPVSFLHFVYLCRVPDDEALMLKLKFGGSTDLQDQTTPV